MIYPYLRLECDGLDPLVVDIDNGYEGATLDLGDAVVREVAESAPDADGTIDTTAHVGARNVTLVANVTAPHSLWSAVQRLRAFTRASLRPTLYVQQEAAAPLQRLTLRRSQWSDVIGGTDRANGFNEDSDRAVTVQWVAPLGIIESSDLNVGEVFAAGTSTAGRVYSGSPGRSYPRTYPTASPQGLLSVTNAGTADAYPVLRLYGPLTDPTITNVTRGKSVALTGLTLTADEYVEIDLRAKTVLKNGDPVLSLYASLDFANTDWWTLSPGVNQIRFRPATYTVALTVAQIRWRDAWY